MDAKGDTHYRSNAELVVPFLNFSAGLFHFFFLMRRKRGGLLCLAVLAWGETKTYAWDCDGTSYEENWFGV